MSNIASIKVPTINEAIEYARHDVVSDAEFAVLHSPEHYEGKYNQICKNNNVPEEVRLAYLKGIDLGFDEALS